MQFDRKYRLFLFFINILPLSFCRNLSPPVCGDLAVSPPVCDDPRIMHQFTEIDYDWPSNSIRQCAIDNEEFIPSNNIISGMKVYKDEIYVTVPRWRRGVPFTLNKIIKVNGTSKLQAFPNKEMQIIGDCNTLQFTQSMEIDPNNGWMWIIDTGRINIFATDGTPIQNDCPAKLIIYDLNKMEEVTRHIFPPDVVYYEKNFLNDVVIQYIEDQPRYAYISDSLDYRLVVFDRLQNTSHSFKHISMFPEPGNGNVTVVGETVPITGGINGIALSSDMQYVYYGPVSGFGLYQIPTRIASKPESNFDKYVRRVGTKPSQSVGMHYSKNNNMYFPVLGENAIYKWEVEYDRKTQGTDFGNVEMKTLTKVLSNDICMNWVDILQFDSDGYLWFSVNKLHKFLLTTMDFTGRTGPNVLIWKVYIGETSYLDRSEIATDMKRMTSMDIILSSLFSKFFQLMNIS